MKQSSHYNSDQPENPDTEKEAVLSEEAVQAKTDPASDSSGEKKPPDSITEESTTKESTGESPSETVPAEETVHHPERPETEEEKTARSVRKLKKNILIAMACLVVFAVIAVPLIQLLDRPAGSQKEEETKKAPPSSIIFFEPDYDLNIMNDPDYRELDRSIHYHDLNSGLTIVLDEKDRNKYGPALPVLAYMLDCIIAGNHEAYNKLFSSHYYKNNQPEEPFTMQQVYDIVLTKVDMKDVTPESGKRYTQYEYELSYKIRRNNGTFRTDIGHDESKKQYFILSDSTTDSILIDQILNYRFQ